MNKCIANLIKILVTESKNIRKKVAIIIADKSLKDRRIIYFAKVNKNY